MNQPQNTRYASHLTRYKKMKNKPNLKSSTIEYQKSCIENMQNEPNFTTNATAKHAKHANFTPISYYLLQLSIRQMRTFTKNSKKIPAFCTFLTLTHLTPCIKKTYINISPQNTLQERNLPTVFLAQKNAKRTQFTKSYVPEGTKTNPISTATSGDSGVIYAKKTTKYYEILQNNPKIYSQKVYISHHFFHSFRFFFYYFYALFCTFCPFSQLLDINTLNSIYNKDLHKYFTPKYPSTNGSRATDHESRLKMKNKPNYQKLMCLKAPKRTQLLIYSSTHPLFPFSFPLRHL